MWAGGAWSELAWSEAPSLGASPVGFFGVWHYWQQEAQGVFKNVASQKITLFCFDSATGLPKTGDAANLTAYVAKDDGTVTVLADTSATETDATNAKGDYLFDLAQAETNADKLRFTGKSSTSGVVVVPVTIYTVPASWTIPRVTLTDTLTTYTGNTPQTGDSFARIGATGSGLTTLAPSATALSTANWTSARAGYLDNVNNATLGAASFPTDPADESLIIAATDAIMTRIGVAGAGLTALGDTRVANLDAAVTSRMATYTQPTGFLAATFPTGTVANTTNITAGTITTATNLTNAPTAGDFTATMKTSIGTAVAASAVASVTGNVGGSVASVVGLTASDVGAIKAKTDNLPASPAAVGSAMTLTSGERDSIAGAVLKLDFAGVSGEAARSVLNALRKLMNKWSISSTTLTVCKEDDATTAYTQTLTATPGADPITALDPN